MFKFRMNEVKEKLEEAKEKVEESLHSPKDPQEEEQVAETLPTPEPDRTAFNCPACKGEGLIGDPYGAHTICQKCQGTGKVSG